MNRRLLGNILIISSLVLTLSGFFMYFFPFSKSTASIHTFFALLFTLAISLHILNNQKALTSYIKGKRLDKFKKLQFPLILILLLSIATGLYNNIPILNQLYIFGNQLRNEQLGKTETNNNYQIIKLDKTVGNHKISVELKKGTAFQYPLFAIWIEDAIGNYIETLYISRVISSSTFDYGVKKNNVWKSATVRRPEALPYWSHKRGIQEADGLYILLENSADLDAVSGATPTSNFIINSKANINSNNDYRVLMEINQSYDWNDYYSKTRFPNDSIYSGSGQVGQPSLIYASIVKNSQLSTTTHKIMNLIGHGHYSGKNGQLYKDLSKITTAKNIAERIILTIN
ncbi:hypothetical protein [Tenacibaculum aiptasiae]|uniref:hypothetical protein n=1 Tax=Tenacibaculum aiptasiae TaxID=426481 RepID=UPI00232FBB67|nr:hypothetical protein [Tenacibaculum aiptasiae]